MLQYMPYIWLGVAVIFGIIEAITMGLTTIWFSGGAIVATFVAAMGFSITIQIVVFLVVSVLLLFFTRPIAVEKLKVGSEKTNMEAVIGKEAIVVTEIMPFQTGQVRIGGQIWTAVAQEQQATISKGTTVVVWEIQGVKVVVKVKG